MDPEVISDAYARQGDALAVAGKYDEAIVLYDRAIEVYPESCEAWTRKATALRMVGRQREALECLERAIDIYPSPIAESSRESLLDEMRRKGTAR